MKTFTAIAVSIILLLVSHQAFANLSLNAIHDDIKVDFFYHGSTVTVSGQSDPDADLIIKISSSKGHQSFKKKGKAAGLLWMNVGELKFEHTPDLFLIHSTKDIDKMLEPEEMEKYGLGYQALEKNAEITGINESNKGKWFAEFLKYKEASNLYRTSTGKIETTEKEGTASYSILIYWPYQAQPGEYKVTVYVVKDGHVVEQAEKSVIVEQVGITKALAGMAKENGALYGIISIAIALGAGFGVGLVFRKGGGAH